SALGPARRGLGLPACSAGWRLPARPRIATAFSPFGRAPLQPSAGAGLNRRLCRKRGALGGPASHLCSAAGEPDHPGGPLRGGSTANDGGQARPACSDIDQPTRSRQQARPGLGSVSTDLSPRGASAGRPLGLSAPDQPAIWGNPALRGTDPVEQRVATRIARASMPTVVDLGDAFLG